ncbi:MAG: hypothetical protein JEY94_17350 [Melioribacteraceae bacterium]|nr:hypothetical protein [Melioribacteraceae bacterium]
MKKTENFALNFAPTKITCVANEGFLIENNSKKILIYALFNDNTITYLDVPTTEILDEIIHSKNPLKI